VSSRRVVAKYLIRTRPQKESLDEWSRPSFHQIGHSGDAEQLHPPMPEEVRPSRDSDVTKLLEGLTVPKDTPAAMPNE
jgi:hypothetical protein